MGIINKIKVREYLAGRSISADFFEELEQNVVNSLIKAKLRADANKRNTIMSRDL